MEKCLEKIKMKRCKLTLVAILAVYACAPVQAPPKVVSALDTPVIRHQAASGCDAAHDRIYLPGVYIDAYPSLPPTADPDHLILHLTDGTTLWGKPRYGSADCIDYMNCRRATLVLNPTWKQCRPQGTSYEVATADGRLVLESDLWEITDLTTKTSAYVGFACGQWFAGSNLTVVSNQTAEKCSSQASTSIPTGTSAAAAIALGAAYFSYHAAYDRPVLCVSDESSSATVNAKCY